MSYQPINQATINKFDDFEVWPVKAWSEGGQSICEQCKPEEASFWSVYGHLKTGGLECLQDCVNEKTARFY